MQVDRDQRLNLAADEYRAFLKNEPELASNPEEAFRRLQDIADRHELTDGRAERAESDLGRSWGSTRACTTRLR
jgi:hypothetical protein